VADAPRRSRSFVLASLGPLGAVEVGPLQAAITQCLDMTFDMRLTHAAHVAALDLTLDRN